MPDNDETTMCSCHDCGGEHAENEMVTAQNNPVCADCLSDNYSTCEECDEVVPNGDIQSVRNARNLEACVCNTCVNDSYFTCDDCGDTHHEFNRNRVNGSSLCDSCFSDNYFCCDLCNGTFNNDDYGEDGRCQSCVDSENDSGVIKDYSTDAPSRKLGTGPHYFGVELEVECHRGHERDGKAQDCLDLLGESFVVCKEDGSLTNGFEIVTAPAALDVQREKWNKFFAGCPSGLKSFQTETCGLHVHCSRFPLSEMTIAKIVCFVNSEANREFVQTIAGRKSGRWAEYKNKPLATACKCNAVRYEAVNLMNPATIEFRIFKGTLKKASLFKAIEFCAALIEFCQPASRSLGDSMSRDKFIAFVNSQRKAYPHLYAFIQAVWLGVQTESNKQCLFKLGLPRPFQQSETEMQQSTEGEV